MRLLAVETRRPERVERLLRVQVSRQVEVTEDGPAHGVYAKEGRVRPFRFDWDERRPVDADARGDRPRELRNRWVLKKHVQGALGPQEVLNAQQQPNGQER